MECHYSDKQTCDTGPIASSRVSLTELKLSYVSSQKLDAEDDGKKSDKAAQKCDDKVLRK